MIATWLAAYVAAAFLCAVVTYRDLKKSPMRNPDRLALLVGTFWPLALTVATWNGFVAAAAWLVRKVGDLW